jgi:hypothetical protein
MRRWDRLVDGYLEGHRPWGVSPATVARTAAPSPRLPSGTRGRGISVASRPRWRLILLLGQPLDERKFQSFDLEPTPISVSWAHPSLPASCFHSP